MGPYSLSKGSALAPLRLMVPDNVLTWTSFLSCERDTCQHSELEDDVFVIPVVE